MLVVARPEGPLLRKGLAQLDAAKRSLLELYYVEERTISEIACLQNRSVSAIKMELCRVRRRLAEIVRNLAEKQTEA